MLLFGTIVFAVFGAVRINLTLSTSVCLIISQGSELLSGQLALSTLSNNGLCSTYLLVIFSVATLVMALPRTLGRLSWPGFISAATITLCGILAMVGAGVSPTPGRSLSATVPTTFYDAFLAITSPVR